MTVWPARLSVNVVSPEEGTQVQGTVPLQARVDGSVQPLFRWFIHMDTGWVELGPQLSEHNPLLWTPPDTLRGRVTLMVQARWRMLTGGDTGHVVLPGDTLPPEVSLIPLGPVLKRDTLWLVQEQTRLQVHAEDPRSGVAWVRYRWRSPETSGGPFLLYTDPLPVPAEEGIHLLEIQAEDRSGNGRLFTFSILVDTQPPTGAWSTSPLGPRNGFWVAAAGDTLHRYYVDSQAGIERLDIQPALPGFQHDLRSIRWPVSPGRGTLTVQVVDSLNHPLQETLRWYGDADPPEVHIRLIQAHPTWSTELYPGDTLMVTATDTPAGVLSLTLQADSLMVQHPDSLILDAVNLPEGTHTLVFKATDSLQHVQETTLTLQIFHHPPDTLPPLVQVEPEGRAVWRAHGWVVGPESLRITVTDPSGITDPRYRWGSESWQTGTDTFRILPPGPGWYVLRVHAQDTRQHTLDTLIRIGRDTMPPDAWLEFAGAISQPNDTVYVEGLRTSLLFHLRDGASPMITGWAEGAVSWDSLPSFALQDSVMTLVVPGETGVHHLTVYSSDSVGNFSMFHWVVVRVPEDSLPPHTRLVVHGQSAGSTPLFLRSGTALTFAATDSGSGVAEILYAFPIQQDTPWQVFSGPVSVPTLPEPKPLLFYARDHVGNREPVRETLIVTDDAPPTISVIPDTPAFRVRDTLWLNGRTGFQVYARDEKVGVAGIQMWLDDTFPPRNGDTTLMVNPIAHGPHQIQLISCDSLLWCDTLNLLAVVDTLSPQIRPMWRGPKVSHGDTLWIGSQTR
ncbi:MAG: hypothetical protein L3J76_04045, partial [Candidatus Hydrothermae bacterium]|nr:hypothetical protein [Candidatus Hydrothermae bacterium]